MSAERERLTAAQAKADEIISRVAEAPEAGPLLRVAVTDAETNQRLGTCFVNYSTGSPTLRLVGEASR